MENSSKHKGSDIITGALVILGVFLIAAILLEAF
ncbi:MAG: hypothetical protein K0R39_1358 [Symbiobacteriaceae bacterium]|jgi:hypothetical protein|nr:hypothetical protein [Symbiobacteriaceae bacterium]